MKTIEEDHSAEVCRCGHSRSQHDRAVRREAMAVCLADGCKCRCFRFARQADEVGAYCPDSEKGVAMKTELRLAAHSVIPGQQVVEIWHDGQFIGQVTGADGPGVRIISKHPLMSSHDEGTPEVVNVRIATPEYLAANN